MRTMCVAFILGIFMDGGIGWTQTQPNASASPKTKLEKFSASTGSVLIRGVTEVGTMTGVYNTSITTRSLFGVSAIELIDASTGLKALGIEVKVLQFGQTRSEKSSYIDYEEIDSLIEGLDYISKLDSSVTQLDNFHATYTTEGDLKISTFTTAEDDSSYLAISSGSYASATAFIRLEDASEIRKILIRAKQKLDKIK